jgi:deoxyribonucleoside regulator
MGRVDEHLPTPGPQPGAVDDAIARVAHQYYVLGLTQADIAKRLGITRFKAHRMLAQARERGMVRVELNVSSASRLALEDRLAERFGLHAAYVCPSDSTPEVPLSTVIGHYAASVAAPLIQDDMTIAVSWGATLRALAMALEPVAAQNLSVVPLLGSLATRSNIDRYEASSLLAQRLNAECFYLPGPILCDSAETKAAIDAQPVIRETLRKARAAGLALLSIGGTTMSSLFDSGVLTAEQRDSALAAGAVGNLLGRFIGRNGRQIEHPLNHLCLGIGPEEVRSVPVRMLCAGGPNKIAAIAGGLRAGVATLLVTDETTGNALLAL